MILAGRLIPLHRRPVEEYQLPPILGRCGPQVTRCAKIRPEREIEGNRLPLGHPLAIGLENIPLASGELAYIQPVFVAPAVHGAGLVHGHSHLELVIALEIKTVQLTGRDLPLHLVEHDGTAIGLEIHCGFHEPDLSLARLSQR